MAVRAQWVLLSPLMSLSEGLSKDTEAHHLQ
jgi:hypothetical protein